MKQGNIKKATLALATTVLIGSMSTANAAGSLSGTKCWQLDPVVGKQTFIRLTFKRIGNKQSVFSGNALRFDGSHKERVLQMSGSTSRYSFTGNDGAEVSTHLLNLTSVGTKLSEDPATLLDEVGHTVLSQYSIRLDPSNLSGAFEGIDTLSDFPGGLTGPLNTYHAKHAANGYNTINPNNFLGGLECNSPDTGHVNCGTVLPINNAGTMTLVGSGKNACKNYEANLGAPQ